MTRIFSCGECGGTSPGTSSTLPLPAMAVVANPVTAQRPQLRGVAVGKKGEGRGSRRLAAETLAGGATPCRLPHTEIFMPSTADTVAETTAGYGFHQKSGDGGGKWGGGREGLHWA